MHLTLRHFIAQDPRQAARLGRRPRLARAVRPSHATEMWYRGELARIVGHLRAAGKALAEELKPDWPLPPTTDSAARIVVQDADPPGFKALLDKTARKFGNIGGVAQRLSALAAKKNLGDVDARLVKSIHSAIGVDVSGALTGDGAIAKSMREAVENNVDLITSIPEQYLDRVEAAVTESWTKGLRWEELVSQIGEIGDITDRRAALIARDQTSKLNSSFNQVRQTDLGIEKFEWQTAEDERVRESHADLDGQVFEWDNPPTVDDEEATPGSPINCFPGDSQIPFAHGVRKAYRRSYRGELTELVTEDGKTIRATPNHPVLTLSGWRPIGSLRQGDDIIEVAEECFDASEGKNKRVPLIADVFASLAEDGISQALDLRPADFHGDGTDGNVDVVFAARPLFLDIIGPGAKGDSKLCLAKASTRSLGPGALLELCLRLLATANGIMGRAREFLALLWTQAFHSQQICFAAATAGCAGFRQNAPDSGSVNAKGLGHGKLALAGLVCSDDRCGVDFEPVVGRPASDLGTHSDRAELGGEVVVAEADDLGRFPDRLPFGHKTGRVLKARTIDGWVGHVYNLETLPGWYVTGGIVTRNCRCVAGPVLETEDDTGAGAPEEEDQDDEERAAA